MVDDHAQIQRPVAGCVPHRQVGQVGRPVEQRIGAVAAGIGPGARAAGSRVVHQVIRGRACLRLLAAAQRDPASVVQHPHGDVAHIGALEVVVAEVRADRPRQRLPHGILALDLLHADDRAAAQILADGRGPLVQLRLELGLIGRRPIPEVAVAVVGRVEQVLQVHGADRELLRPDFCFDIHHVRRILDADRRGIFDQQHVAAELIGQHSRQIRR